MDMYVEKKKKNKYDCKYYLQIFSKETVGLWPLSIFLITFQLPNSELVVW